VARPGDDIRFDNVDILTHDVIAIETDASTSRPWCASFATGACPLFWSPTVGLAGSRFVEGTENLTAGNTYHFYCSWHPFMEGTLVIAPA
ncbi:MAG TPA: hypothetical protein VI541_03565, partial [Actinomycetota bacterium]|nr:hypothetical protein [Actinomycetota bacterium]